MSKQTVSMQILWWLNDMALWQPEVVLCDLRRQITRATNWAKVLRRDLRVHVCERSSIPDFLLDGETKQAEPSKYKLHVGDIFHDIAILPGMHPVNENCSQKSTKALFTTD
eukprot:762001-Amphidinium_carterae.1